MAQRKIGLRTKLLYGFGQLAEGVKNNAFETFLFFYYNQVLGLSGTLAGLAVFIALCFDAVTDPVTGSISDSTRSKWGRRHPYMYVSAIPLAITFYLLFDPPDGLGQAGLFVWLTVFAVLVRGAMTLFHVPHLSLGAELSNDYSERTSIVGYRYFFSLLGGAGTIFIGLGYFFQSTPEFPVGQLNHAAYVDFGLVLAIVMLFAVVGTTAGTHDQIRHLKVPKANPESFHALRVLRELREALSIKSFRYFFVGVVIFFIMRGVQMTLGLHIGTYFWEFSSANILTITLGILFGVIVGIPMARPLAARFDKKPTYLFSLFFYMFWLMTPLALRIWGYFPENGDPVLLPIITTTNFLSGIGGGLALVLAGSMMADVTDEHELRYERRQEGIFFGALSFSAKASAGVGHSVAGIAIDIIHFPIGAEPGTIDSGIVRDLGIIYGPGVALIGIVAVLFIFRYDLSRHRHAEIQRALTERGEAAAEPQSAALGPSPSARPALAD